MDRHGVETCRRGDDEGGMVGAHGGGGGGWTRSLMLLINFLIRALANSPVFGGLGLVPMGEGGVLPLLLHRFHFENRVKMLRNLAPPPNFFRPPPGGLAILREKNIVGDCVAEAVHEVTTHRGGWAVSHHGGVGGGIRGGGPAGVLCARGARP